MYNTAFLFLFSSLSLAGRLSCAQFVGGEKNVIGICPEGWRFELWILLDCLSAAEDVGVQELPCLTISCKVQVVFSVFWNSEVSNSPWELRRICVPFWAVCGSKSGVFSLTSALLQFLSFIGFRFKSGLLMQNKSCFFQALVPKIMISKFVMFDLMQVTELCLSIALRYFLTRNLYRAYSFPQQKCHFLHRNFISFCPKSKPFLHCDMWLLDFFFRQ